MTHDNHYIGTVDANETFTPAARRKLCPDLETAYANARLMAAAPALLDALQAMIEEWNRHGCCDSRDVVNHAQAAITKATKGD
jgi:hypothetical protein